MVEQRFYTAKVKSSNLFGRTTYTKIIKHEEQIKEYYTKCVAAVICSSCYSWNY